MAQVDQIGQPGAAVGGDDGRDLDHLHERDGALLHAGAARHQSREQRQALSRRSLDGQHHTFGSGDADRSGEEADSHATTATRRPRISPAPVSTASSSPVRWRALSRSAA
jgi:hypothetical protein